MGASGGLVRLSVVFLWLALSAAALPRGFFGEDRQPFRGDDTTARQNDLNKYFAYDIVPSTTKPAKGSAFFGMPPPEDSPFMEGVSTPRSLLTAPTGRTSRTAEVREAFDERTTEPYREEWPSTGYSRTKGGRIAKKWCLQWQNRCRATKRDVAELSIRIAGGEPARPKEHPHMVMIGTGELSNPSWFCGGSLISENYVLTAAHCIKNSNMEEARWVRLGDLDIATGRDGGSPQTREISEKLVHPDYKPPQVYNDVALLKLDRPADLTSWVSPVCLSPGGPVEEAYTKAVITGWGRTGFISETSSKLMEVEVSLFNRTRCEEMLNKNAGPKMARGFDRQSMVCAGEERGGKDACQGDSGGPLVVESGEGCAKIQLGITSVGNECGLAGSPGIYTKVSHYLSWIEGIVWR